MTINNDQRLQTAGELADNLRKSGLSVEQLETRCELPQDRFALALQVAEGVRPGDVWVVRDVLETAVREAGGDPTPYSTLTEEMRASAKEWFGVEDRR